MIIKFTCEYNGAGFKGFQRQKDLRTVQSVLESALTKYFGEKITVTGSGRTDAGVHALGQVCSFKAPQPPDKKCFSNLFKMTAAINAFLPSDVAVRDFEVMPDGFSAQFSAKSKTYIYKFYVGRHRRPLFDATHLQLYKMPDIERMRAAAKHLVGEHNFKSFVATDGKAESKKQKSGSKNIESESNNIEVEKGEKTDYVRTIYSFDILQPDGDIIQFVVRGNGFLRNMLRIMSGIILDVGYHVITPARFREIFEARDRQLAGKTLPAHGLTLCGVEY
jgi:tRNA pseudouridine38-40 synthase